MFLEEQLIAAQVKRPIRTQAAMRDECPSSFKNVDLKKAFFKVYSIPREDLRRSKTFADFSEAKCQSRFFNRGVFETQVQLQIEPRSRTQV